jgi:hypothetical protein
LIFLVIIPFLTSKNTKDTKILGEWGRRNREQGRSEGEGEQWKSEKVLAV